MREDLRNQFARGGHFALQHLSYHAFLTAQQDDTHYRMTTLYAPGNPYGRLDEKHAEIQAISSELAGPDYDHRSICTIVPAKDEREAEQRARTAEFAAAYEAKEAVRLAAEDAEADAEAERQVAEPPKPPVDREGNLLLMF